MRWINVMRAVWAKALLQCVDGAGADVTEDNTQCCDDESGGGKFMEAVLLRLSAHADMCQRCLRSASEQKGYACEESVKNA